MRARSEVSSRRSLPKTHENAYFGQDRENRRVSTFYLSVGRFIPHGCAALASGLTDHSAAGSLAGYEWQLQLALRALFRMTEGGFVEVETSDDVAIYREPGLFSTAQTKHSFVSHTITENSPEFWKTLRVWLNHMSGQTTGHAERLRLCSTGNVVAGSTLDILASPPGARSVQQIEDLAARIDQVANARGNVDLAECYRQWSRAHADLQRQVLEKAEIEHGQAGLTASRAALSALIREKGFEVETIDLATRLVAGWFSMTVTERLRIAGCRVSVSELLDVLGEIRRVTPPFALASSYADASYGNPGEQNRPMPTYLRQLVLVEAEDELKDAATLMFMRATDERRSWSENIPIARVILKEYDANLHNKWMMTRAMLLSPAPGDEAEARRRGRRIHDACMDYHGALANTPALPHVAYGSYHILSNMRRLGWHPNWRDLTTGEEEQS
jgi:hypothetical protein